MRQERSLQEFVRGTYIFFFQGGAQQPLGRENPLKSIDCIVAQNKIWENSHIFPNISVALWLNL